MVILLFVSVMSFFPGSINPGRQILCPVWCNVLKIGSGIELPRILGYGSIVIELDEK
jgi:hypothetical protein